MRQTTIRLLLFAAFLTSPSLATAAECLVGSMKGLPESDTETVAVPGADVFPGMGLVFRGAFETEDFAVVGDLRIGGGSKTEAPDQATTFSASINGRYFFLDGGWTPFVVGGLGWSALRFANDEFDTSESGMSGNVEVGLEFLRFYKEPPPRRLPGGPALLRAEAAGRTRLELAHGRDQGARGRHPLRGAHDLRRDLPLVVTASGR